MNLTAAYWLSLYSASACFLNKFTYRLEKGTYWNSRALLQCWPEVAWARDDWRHLHWNKRFQTIGHEFSSILLGKSQMIKNQNLKTVVLVIWYLFSILFHSSVSAINFYFRKWAIALLVKLEALRNFGYTYFFTILRHESWPKVWLHYSLSSKRLKKLHLE